MSQHGIQGQGPSEREQIREVLATNARKLDERIQTAWDEEMDPDAERLQLTRLRTLSHLAKQYRLLARDDDIDQMESQVAALETLLERGDG